MENIPQENSNVTDQPEETIQSSLWGDYVPLPLLSTSKGQALSIIPISFWTAKPCLT